MSPSVMAKVYVGNIDRRTEKRDLEQEFGRFGKIRQIQIWADRHPAGFAFVEYEDDRFAFYGLGLRGYRWTAARLHFKSLY